MKLVIFKGQAIKVPYKVLLAIAIISFLLTLGILWIINYLNMPRLLILILPAYFSTFLTFWAVKINFLKPLAIPLDLNLAWIDGRRIFGNSKTFLGFIAGVTVGIIVGYLISLMANVFSTTHEAVFFGFLAGLGAMVGDLIRSFFKRRIGLKSGETWFIFDDLDFVVGALLFLGIYINFPTTFIVLVLAGTLSLRILTNSFDFIFKLKKFY